jgi:fructuronate reductase
MPIPQKIHAKLLPLLKNKQIFGVDLEEAGISDEVLSMFAEMLSGKGAVRTALQKYCA